METWLQRLIAAGLRIGIRKRELMEDYYPAELPLVLKAYARLRESAPGGAEATDPMTFFGTGGERIDG